MKSQFYFAVLVASLFLSNTLFAQEAGNESKREKQSGNLLFENMGPYNRQFSTRSKESQAFLNQGMVWLQAFNHDEARRSFLRAAELDPKCAWAWWGVAYCEGPNYNDPAPDDNRSRAAWYALQNAIARVDNASAVERDLIDALRARFSNPWPKDRSSLDLAYAKAMEKMWQKYPDDADVGALYAEAMMQLKPWQLYTQSRQPVEGTLKIRQLLEQVMKMDPKHAGAKHLYIHAVEPSVRPEDALKAARELNDLVPASGHLLHMPSHIYIQTGHWQEAIRQNIKAVESDRNYRKQSPNQMIQYLYQAHNAHMLAFAAMMTGQEKTAMEYAKEIWKVIPPEQQKAKAPVIDFSLMCIYDVQKRFGRWDDILKEKQPPEYLPLTTAYWRAHRAIAYAAKKDFYHADVEFAKFMKAKSDFPPDSIKEGTFNHRILKVGEHFIQGEIALQKEDWDSAIWHLKKAVKIEDTLRYTEPPYWLQPVRHTLGAVYMKSGQYEKAEAVFRKDLKIWKDNGWSLYGLSQAFEAQGKTAETKAVMNSFKRIWASADEPILKTSCKCLENLNKSVSLDEE